MSINHNDLGYPMRTRGHDVIVQSLHEGFFGYGTSCEHFILAAVGTESVDRAWRGITPIWTAMEAGSVPSAMAA